MESCLLSTSKCVHQPRADFWPPVSGVVSILDAVSFYVVFGNGSIGRRHDDFPVAWPSTRRNSNTICGHEPTQSPSITRAIVGAGIDGSSELTVDALLAETPETDKATIVKIERTLYFFPTHLGYQQKAWARRFRFRATLSRTLF